jgi:hypothetical protein
MKQKCVLGQILFGVIYTWSSISLAQTPHDQKSGSVGSRRKSNGEVVVDVAYGGKSHDVVATIDSKTTVFNNVTSSNRVTVPKNHNAMSFSNATRYLVVFLISGKSNFIRGN